MVDAESVTERLNRLAELVGQLEETGAHGLDAYLRDDVLRAATERRLQLAEQICIDVGAHILSEINARPPGDYAGIFTALADADYLDRHLAARLAAAARQRNLLIHLYLDIDDRKVFESLEHLDDLRSFAAAVHHLLDGEG